MQNNYLIRVLCMSDIHGNQTQAENILKNEKYDLAISSGDTELEFEWIQNHFHFFVTGNNDFDRRLPLESKFNLGNVSVYLTHGHILGAYDTLVNEEKIKNATQHINQKLIVYGHSHYPVYFYDSESGKTFINPGSITYPRFGSKKSYCLIDLNIEKGTVEKVQFKNIT